MRSPCPSRSVRTISDRKALLLRTVIRTAGSRFVLQPTGSVAIGGAVFGFFLGMLVGLFEDLSIPLHIHEIFEAVTKLPDLIGKLFGNPSILLAMFVDMITAHMTRCMLVNPYGTPPGTTEQWADWVAKRFFGQEPGGTNVVIFGVACTVGSIVGYLVQQFIIGTGIVKVFGKLKEAGKFASLAGKLSDGAKAVKSTVGDAVKVAKGAVQRFTRGAAEAVNRFLERIGLKFGDDAAQGVAACVARLGAAHSCYLDRLGRMGREFVESVHVKIGKWPQNVQDWVHRWADEFAGATG